jgi:hypothetical protein
MLQSMFSEVLTRDAWFVLWDHVFVDLRNLPLFFVIAFLKYFREPLMKISKVEDVQVNEPKSTYIHQTLRYQSLND